MVKEPESDAIGQLEQTLLISAANRSELGRILAEGHEYVLVVTEGRTELKEAADYLQEQLDNLEESYARRFVVKQITNAHSAIEFWREKPLSVPLIVVDKRGPNSPGSMLKLMHSEVDPDLVTEVVNAYASRTEEGVVSQDTVNKEDFLRTIQTELKETQERRHAKLNPLTFSQKEAVATRLAQSIGRYLPQYGPYLEVGKEAQDEEAQKLAKLATPGMKLSMVIQTFKDHHGKRNPASQDKVSAAASLLKTLLHEVPPGIVYVTLAEKEGIFAHEAALAEDDKTVYPAYVVKRFEKLQQAKHVHHLSQLIQQNREDMQNEGGLVRFQTPQTYWPSNVNGFSILFMDPAPGEDLLTLLPKINSEIKKGSIEAAKYKSNIITACLDNIAYWQRISPQVASEMGGYQAPPAEIRNFLERAIKGSWKTLEAVTNAALSDMNQRAIGEAGSKLPSLVSEQAALGLDSGVKNIRLVESGRTLADVTNNLWHIDLPHEWRTVHKMRDAVRLLFAPATDLSVEEINKDAAYLVLREEYGKVTREEEAAREQRKQLENQMSLVLDPQKQTDLPLAILEGRDAYKDLYLVATAEAARMTEVITLVFLSKVRAAMRGEIKTTLKNWQLEEKYKELTGECKKWAQVGLNATRQIEYAYGGTGEKFYGLKILFEAWVKAKVIPEKLPVYQQFAKV